MKGTRSDQLAENYKERRHRALRSDNGETSGGLDGLSGTPAVVIFLVRQNVRSSSLTAS